MPSLWCKILPAAVAVFLLLSAGCAQQRTLVQGNRPTPHAAVTPAGERLPCRQLLVVTAERRATSLAELYFLELGEKGWQISRGPVRAMIGRNGFAPPGEKREGDGKTPTGLLPLEFAFGYAPSIASAMPYRQATADDLWVDDVNSADYNTWVKRGTTAASSYEAMMLPDRRYRHGLVVGYNRNPVVKGKGSAIFAHPWQEEGKSTAGCVSLDEDELVKIIGRLDPAQKPMILMGSRGDLASLTGSASMPVPALLATPQGQAASNELEQEIQRRLSGTTGRQVEYRSAEGFFGVAARVPKAVEREMLSKKSWREGCPVSISDLSYLVLTHWGFDGKPHVGELVVHRKLALPTVKAFADLYALRFPIEKMERIELYDGDDHRSMEANNTSGFNCRDVAGRPGVFSNHSYGSAIDINPVQNPYLVPKSGALRVLGWNGTEDRVNFLVKLGYSRKETVANFCARDAEKCQVSPPNGLPFLDRNRSVAGLIVDGPVLRAFTSRGFEWGGLWRSSVDYQHVEVKPSRLR